MEEMPWLHVNLRWWYTGKIIGYIAKCLNVNVASEGDTEAEALANLQEALELYFEDDGQIEVAPVAQAKLTKPMPRVSRTYSSASIAKVLLRHSFRFVSRRGSHVKLRKAGSPTRTVIVPMGRKDMCHRTFRSITEQAGLAEDDFRYDRAA
jgi:predicted RNA binding protein YcfA (HicA-like mRNA interferase family)